MNNKAIIQLLDTKVMNLNLAPLGSDVESESVSLSFDPSFDLEAENLFWVNFDIELSTKEVCLKVEFSAKFETNGRIDDEFRNSHFILTNAPAIAYPYLRSYVSTVLLQSGYTPLTLPAINFNKFTKAD